MTRLGVTNLRPIAGHPGAVEAQASIESGSGRFALTYRVSQGPASETSSGFLAASLLPAMRIGEPLEVEGALSPRLMAAIPRIEGVMSGWFKNASRIEVNAGSAPEPKASGVACFFSGGIDSFYSVLSHLDEITGLVFVHGFDIQPRDVALRARISESLRKTAARLGKPLIEVETNLRAFSDRHAMWVQEYHGSALASVALLLSPQFGRFYIPATFSRTFMAPWGSHPHLDRLWSTDATEILHDGSDATRVQKAQLLAQFDVALQSLRVCWKNHGGQYNCGRCEKCLLTMVNLRVVGALDRCTTFNKCLDVSAVARSPIPDLGARTLIEENLQAARETGDAELVWAIARSLKRKQGRLIDRVRQGDIHGKVGRRLQRALGRPMYNWDLSDLALTTQLQDKSPRRHGSEALADAHAASHADRADPYRIGHERSESVPS